MAYIQLQRDIKGLARSLNNQKTLNTTMTEVTETKKYGCGCGRSPTGVCTGLHKLTNEQFKVYLEQQQKSLNEQTKPQFLVD